MKTTPTTKYLKPILKAAALLNVRVYPYAIERLTLVLDKLANGFPGDVLRPVHALAILEDGMTGTVEELEILDKLWPSYFEKRYVLTPTTLTVRLSSKHTGRHATITVPFPTILPMQVTVVRSCDMDDVNNHGEECQAEGEDFSGDCHCESFVEQSVIATVQDWDTQAEEALTGWLERAVETQVEALTL